MMPSGIWSGWAIVKDLPAGLSGSPVAPIGVREPVRASRISTQTYAWMHEFAKNHRRWGHRRAWMTAFAEGYGGCREPLRRLWHEEGLRVLPRKKRKRLAVATDRDVPAGQYPGDVWALDFQFDSTWHGNGVGWVFRATRLECVFLC